MREIKFRIYIPSINKMIYPTAGNFHDLIEGEDWKVMQYTGLKDKNGVENYFDDIIDVCVFFVTPENPDYDIHFRGVLVESDLKVSIKIYKFMNDLKGWKSINEAGFPFDLDYKEEDNTYIVPIYDLCAISGNLGKIQQENIETIGNIHENPELLK